MFVNNSTFKINSKFTNALKQVICFITSLIIMLENLKLKVKQETAYIDEELRKLMDAIKART